MPCEGLPVGHCMLTDPSTGFEHSACCDPFADLYEFVPVDTPSRHCCWVGIRSLADSCEGGEQVDGRWCGWGCSGTSDDESGPDPAICDDTMLADMADRTDGRRWLRPHPSGYNRDAFGMLHDLRSYNPQIGGDPNGGWHPVPRRRITYLRGTCWDNSGLECFGTDACACYGDNAADWWASERDEGYCSPDVPIGAAVRGLLPDGMFSTGFGWPPSNRRLNQSGPNDFWCRQFGAGRGGQPVTEVTLSAPMVGGIDGRVEPMPGPIRASDHNCHANGLTRCMGYVQAGSVCGTSQHHVNPDQIWYNDDPASRNRFDPLLILDNSAAHRVCPDNPAPGELANTILEYVKSHDIGGISFDRLDSLVYQGYHNAGLGQYSRQADLIAVEVPGVFGACRLAKTGCPVSAKLYIRAVRVFCHVIPQLVEPTPPPYSLDRYIAPLARFQIAVELLTVAELSESCTLRQSWRPDGDPLREVELRIVEGSRVEPALDVILFVDPLGRPVVPPRTVEWWGMLGGHSRPTTASQTRRVDPGERGLCHGIADAWQGGIEIPAWPMRAETNPDEPAGQYVGSVRIGTKP